LIHPQVGLCLPIAGPRSYTMRVASRLSLFRARRGPFLESQLNGEAGRTMVGEMDNLSFLSRFEKPPSEAGRAALKNPGSRYLTTLEIALATSITAESLRRIPDSLPVRSGEQ
jgi:hypothetical protein